MIILIIVGVLVLIIKIALVIYALKYIAAFCLFIKELYE